MIGALAFAFGAGSVATVNPCGFALLPAYLARRLAMDDGAGTAPETIARALAAGAAMTLGFLLVFGVGGGLVALGAQWLTAVFPWVGFAIGIVIAVIGVAVLAGRRFGLGLPPPRPNTAVTGLRGDLAFGLGYGTVSLSCTLPIFLAVTGTAITGGAVVSALSVMAYAFGMGTIVMALALGAALSRRSLALACKGLLPYVTRVSGVLLVLSGVYIAYFWGSSLLSEAPSGAGSLILTGERVSGTLRGWVSGTEGQTVIYGLLALLAALSVWALWRRLTSERGAGHSGSKPVHVDHPIRPRAAPLAKASEE